VSQQQQPALVTPNTFTLCLHILVVLASNSTTISLQLLRQVKVFSQQETSTHMAFMLGPPYYPDVLWFKIIAKYRKYG
jgi:hypothetical protein